MEREMGDLFYLQSVKREEGEKKKKKVRGSVVRTLFFFPVYNTYTHVITKFHAPHLTIPGRRLPHLEKRREKNRRGMSKGRLKIAPPFQRHIHSGVPCSEKHLTTDLTSPPFRFSPQEPGRVPVSVKKLPVCVCVTCRQSGEYELGREEKKVRLPEVGIGFFFRIEVRSDEGGRRWPRDELLL